jgi:hypothetical protein
MVAYLPRANRYGHRDTTIVLVAYKHGVRGSELVATLPSAGPGKAHRLRSAIFGCRLSIRRDLANVLTSSGEIIFSARRLNIQKPLDPLIPDARSSSP